MPRFDVQFQRVSKVYRAGLFARKRIHALRAVTLDIPRGSVFGVLGPNRAGKTTLVKTLLSICRPTSGAILRLGRAGEDRGTLAQVGYLHERQAFPQYLNAATLLRFYGAMSLVPESQLARRIPALLDQLGLADRAAEPILSFSKGMLQRLALAQALVNDPQLLVLDEPTEGMDMAGRKLLHETIARRRKDGATAIFVSHSIADVQRLCDLAVVLRDGQAAYCGSLAELVGEDPAGAPADALQEALEPVYAGTSA